MASTTEGNQQGSSNTDAEWKAGHKLGNVIHDAGNPSSAVDRSNKAAPPPDVASGSGTLSGGKSDGGVKGWTGDGKGPLNPGAADSKDTEARK